MGGVTRQEAASRDTTLPTGSWVLFDLYATNHDDRIWSEPHVQPRPVPPLGQQSPRTVRQGAGDVKSTHRCPRRAHHLGTDEGATLLLCNTDDRIPVQDLSISLGRNPRCRTAASSSCRRPHRRCRLPLPHASSGNRSFAVGCASTYCRDNRGRFPAEHRLIFTPAGACLLSP